MKVDMDTVDMATMKNGQLNCHISSNAKFDSISVLTQNS